MTIRGVNLIRAVRLSLGQDRGFGLSVPLSDTQIIYAIKNSIAEYGRYHPRFSYQSTLAPIGTSEIIPAPKVRSIRDLQMMPINTLLPITLPEMALIGGQFISWGTAIDYKVVQEYSIYLQWKEAADTVFSNRPAYCFLPDANRVYIYSPASSVKVSFTGELDWYTAPEEDLMWDDKFNDPNSTDAGDQKPSTAHPEHLDEALGLIPENHVANWVRKLAIGESMKILGRMFSRYGSIPGVDGKDIQLNGPALIEEGTVVWDETLKEVRLASVAAIPPVFR